MWRPLLPARLAQLTPDDYKKIIIARRRDGKCCVGHIEDMTDKTIEIRNGSYSVTLWFSEPRMFTLVEPPHDAEFLIGERNLPLEGQ